MHPFIPVLSPSFLYHPYIPSFKSKDFSFICLIDFLPSSMSVPSCRKDNLNLNHYQPPQPCGTRVTSRLQHAGNAVTGYTTLPHGCFFFVEELSFLFLLHTAYYSEEYIAWGYLLLFTHLLCLELCYACTPTFIAAIATIGQL